MWCQQESQSDTETSNMEATNETTVSTLKVRTEEIMHHLWKKHKVTTVQFSGISPNLVVTSLCFLQEGRRVVRG